MIWHNPKLELLNLSNTGLIQPAIHRLAQSLKYGLAIKSLRMSGNLSLKGDEKLVQVLQPCQIYQKPLPVRTWNEQAQRFEKIREIENESKQKCRSQILRQESLLVSDNEEELE